MLKLRNRLLLLFIIFFLVSVIFFVCISFKSNNLRSYATTPLFLVDDFELKENVTDKFDETKKAISLSTDKKGSKVNICNSFSGNFAIDLKAKGEVGEVPALKSFSIIFTEIDTGDSFSLKIAYSKEKIQLTSGAKATSCLVTDCSVIYDDVRAGIYYKETNFMSYELTSGYNNQNKHTRFYYGEDAVIIFDAKNLVLTVNNKTAKNQNYVLKIWDFKKEVNDGKKLKNSLDSFLNYNVSISFDDISAGQTGELLIYAMSDDQNEYIFDNNEKTYISADLKYNAIVGQSYTIPDAVVTKVFMDNQVITTTASVKFNNKDVLIVDNTFIPTNVGEYTLVYNSTSDGNIIASKEYKINAYLNATKEIELSSSFSDCVIGLNDCLYIPSANLISNLNNKTRKPSLAVTIKKNGEVVKETSTGGFDYRFLSTGDYSVIYSNTAFDFEKVYCVTVSHSNVGILESELQESYPLNYHLSPESLKAYYGGNEIVSTMSVSYPSGKVIEGDSFDLNELGNYKINYRFNVDENDNNIEKKFTVKNQLDSYFEYNDASVSYGTSSYNCSLDGALFTVKNNTLITFTDIIDVKSMSFNDADSYTNKLDGNKYVPFIEIGAVPSIMGSADLTTIFITLTDLYDETNSISVRLRLAEAGASHTKIRAQAKNQTYTGQNFKWNSTYTGIDTYTVENAAAHEFGGFSSSNNFTQTPGANNTSYSTCKLYYDYESNALYSTPQYTKIGSDEIKWLVCDFDDDKFFGTPWTGFRQGLAKLSVSFAGVEGSANILIRSINGVNFDNELIDDSIKPSIVVDLGGETSAPYGQVGVKYPIPSFVVKDNSGIITEKNFKVFYNNIEIDVNNGCFTPTNMGNYVIRYFAKDSFDNVSTEDVYVRVLSYVAQPIINVEEDIISSVEFGDTIYIPEFSATGGAGNIKKVISVSCNGSEIDVNNGQVVCNKVGTFIISLKVIDHIGKFDVKNYYVNVLYTNSPTINLDDIVLPPAFIGGEEFVFDNYYANYYASESSSPEKILANISVFENGVEKPISSDGKYIPTKDNSINEVRVVLSFVKNNAETKVIEKIVPLHQITEKAKFMEDFFIVDNAVISSNSSEVSFTTKDSNRNVNISFIRAINVKSLSIDLRTHDFNFSELIVRLRDSKNSNQVVDIKYIYENNNLYAVINSNRYKAYFKDGVLGINFDQKTFDITDKNNTWTGSILKYNNDLTFNGFDSNYVYLTLTLKGCNTDATIGLSQIGNQNFNYLTSDMVKPILEVNGNLSGKYGINSKLVTPTATAYDILFSIKSLKLTIVDPKNEIVYSGNADTCYEIILGQYGVYQFIYEALDSSVRANNSYSTKTITVYDATAPTLTFDREMEKEICIGNKYLLPTYTIVDNSPAEKVIVHITVINPRGLADTVKDGYVKFLYKGTYLITYYVIDEDGNNNLYSFEIIAKENK